MKVQVSTPDGSSKANLLWCGWCWRGAILESSLYVYIPLSLTTLKTDPVELTAKILVRARPTSCAHGTGQCASGTSETRTMMEQETLNDYGQHTNNRFHLDIHSHS